MNVRKLPESLDEILHTMPVTVPKKIVKELLKILDAKTREIARLTLALEEKTYVPPVGTALVDGDRIRQLEAGIDTPLVAKLRRLLRKRKRTLLEKEKAIAALSEELTKVASKAMSGHVAEQALARVDHLLASGIITITVDVARLIREPLTPR